MERLGARSGPCVIFAERKRLVVMKFPYFVRTQRYLHTVNILTFLAADEYGEKAQNTRQRRQRRCAASLQP